MSKLKQILFVFLWVVCYKDVHSQNRIKVMYPGNGVFLLDTAVNFKWNIYSPTNSFFKCSIYISTDSLFNGNVQIYSDITSQEYLVTLNQNKVYFYRIAGYNLLNNNDSISTAVRKISFINYTQFQTNLLHYSSENVVSSGNVITSIIDNSLFGNNAIQNNASQRATLAPMQLNGKPAMRFDGTDDVYFFTAIDSIRTAFWIIMDKIATPSSVLYYRYLLGSNTKFDFARFLPSHCVANFAAAPIYNAKYRINRNNINGQTQGLPAGRPCAVSMKTLGGYGSASNFSLDRGIYPRVWDGDVYRIVLFKDTLSDIAINSIESYLMDYYAPPVNLGSFVRTCASNYTIAANGNQYTKWLWSTGDTNSSIVVNNSGNYWVRTTDIFNRISVDTLFINFDTTDYKVKLPNDTFVCKGNIFALNAGPNHLKYTWNNGDTTAVRIISNSGTYVVSVKNCKNNTYSDTIVLFVSDKKPNLPDSATYCFNSFVTLDPLLTGNLTYSWNSGPSTKIINVNSVGRYILSVTDSLNCVFKDTTWVSVDSSLKNSSLGPNVSLCDGNRISLLSQSPAITKFQWSTGDTTSFTIVKNTGDYAVTVSNSRNCQQRDTVLVTIIGSAPTIRFDIQNRCESAITEFYDLSVPSGGNTISSRKWKFTANDSSNLASAEYAYLTKGYKVVNFSVTTNVGCTADTAFTLYIYSRPKANFRTGVSCANANIPFTNLTTFDPLDSPSQWKWFFGDGALDTIRNPLHAYDSSMAYSATLSVVSKNQCTDIVTKTLDIFPEIKLDIDFSSSCANDTTFIAANSISKSIVAYNWDLTNGNFASGKKVKLPFNQSGNFTISLAVENAIGCRDTFYKSIDVVAKPNITILSDKGCVNKKFIFKDSTIINAKDSIIDYLWIINGKDSLRGRTPIYYFRDSGTFTMMLQVKTKLGCENMVQQLVTIGYTPIAQFTYSPTIGDVPLWINFTNTSINGTKYQWIINSNDTSEEKNIRRYFEQYGNYNVSLKASNNFGCANTFVQEIKLYPSELDLFVEKLIAKETKDIKGKMTYELSFRASNIGNRPIKSFDVMVSNVDGTLWQESWIGDIEVGNSANVNLLSKPTFTTEYAKSYLCVEAVNINNGEKDRNSGNNSDCINIAGSIITKIYPIPVTDLLHLYISAAEEKDIVIKINNLKGLEVIYTERVKVQNGMNHFSFDASQWPKGVYVAEIIEASSARQIKFIVE